MIIFKHKTQKVKSLRHHLCSSRARRKVSCNQCFWFFFKLNISTCSNSYPAWWVQCHKYRVYHPDISLIPANSRERGSAEISSVLLQNLEWFEFSNLEHCFLSFLGGFCRSLANFQLILIEKPVFLTKKRFSIFSTDLYFKFK